MDSIRKLSSDFVLLSSITHMFPTLYLNFFSAICLVIAAESNSNKQAFKRMDDTTYNELEKSCVAFVKEYTTKDGKYLVKVYKNRNVRYFVKFEYYDKEDEMFSFVKKELVYQRNGKGRVVPYEGQYDAVLVEEYSKVRIYVSNMYLKNLFTSALTSCCI